MITKFNGITEEEYPTIYALEKSGVDLYQESGFLKEKSFVDFLKSRGFKEIEIKPSGRGIGRNTVSIDGVHYGEGGSMSTASFVDFHSRFWTEKLLLQIMQRIGKEAELI